MAERPQFQQFLASPLPAILTSTFTAGFGFGIVLPVSSVVLEQMQVPTPVIGLIATVMFAGMAFGAPLSGKLIDLFGVRCTLSAGLLCNAAAMAALGLWVSIPAWVLTRFIMGVAFASVFTSCETLINRISNERNRGRNLGIYAFAFSLSLILGPAGLWLLELGTWVPFAVSGGICLAASFLVFVRIPPSGEPDSGLKFSPALVGRIRLSVVTMLMAGFMEGALLALIPIYALRLGYGTAAAGLLLFAFVLGHGGFPPVIGMLGDRIGLKRVLTLTYALGTVAFVCILFASSRETAAGWLLLGGASVGALYPLAVGLLADVLSDAELPRGNAVTTFCYGLGSLAGPFVPALVMHVTVPKSLFALPAALYALLLVWGWQSKTKKPIRRG